MLLETPRSCSSPISNEISNDLSSRKRLKLDIESCSSNQSSCSSSQVQAECLGSEGESDAYFPSVNVSKFEDHSSEHKSSGDQNLRNEENQQGNNVSKSQD